MLSDIMTRRFHCKFSPMTLLAWLFTSAVSYCGLQCVLVRGRRKEILCWTRSSSISGFIEHFPTRCGVTTFLLWDSLLVYSHAQWVSCYLSLATALPPMLSQAESFCTGEVSWATMDGQWAWVAVRILRSRRYSERYGAHGLESAVLKDAIWSIQ